MKTNKVWLTLRMPNQQSCSIEYWIKRCVDCNPRHYMRFRSVDAEADTFEECASILKTNILKRYKL